VSTENNNSNSTDKEKNNNDNKEDTNVEQNSTSDKKVSYKRAEDILEKQFEAHYKIQDNLFKAVRLVAIGVTVIGALISFPFSNDLNLPDPSQTAQNEITDLSGNVGIILFDNNIFTISEFLASAIVLIGILLMALLAFYFFIKGAVEIGVAAYNLINGLQSPSLEPINSEYTISEGSSVSDKDTIGDWIIQNHKKIDSSSKSLDNVYSGILRSAIYILLSLIAVVFGYVANPSVAILYFLSTLVFYCLHYWGSDDEIITTDISELSRFRKSILALISLVIFVIYIGLILITTGG